MKNELRIFRNERFGEIRTLEEGGKILFCGSDAARALGYDQPHKAIERHCRYGTKHTVPHPQSNEKTIEMIFIPEGDLYRLITHSKLPTAEQFEQWVFDEVLPSIRKHGVYATAETAERLMNDPDFMIKTFTALKEERQARIMAEKQNRKMLPKAEFYDAVTGANCRTAVEMRVVSGVLNYKGIGRNKLFEILRQEGILSQDNLPYQRYKDAGWFRVAETKYTQPDGDVCVSYKTVVYQKGIAAIKRILDRLGYDCMDRPIQASII